MFQATTPPIPSTGPDPPGQHPRLLDQLRHAARARGHPEATIAAFASWITRFILFHGKRHPREMGLAEVGRFLDHVVRTEKDPLPNLEVARGAGTGLAVPVRVAAAVPLPANGSIRTASRV
ncbi:MAG TPA: phage integrase N-terminal SAM-like domain-containing protein [Gemmataceae bacterium]|nr:phage integrase N-terminal SAM-like domain-containing protein [Gemmataceae bacterium]